MSESSKAVFLSYASQDAEAAKRICDALRAAGVEVWFDAEGGLEHGDEWDAKIRKQVKECVLFIAVISANTQAREEGYFRIEWDMAAERARGIASGVAFLLPVVVDDTREPDALVPDRFRTVQWTRLKNGEVPPEVLQRFLKLWSHRTGVLKHEAMEPGRPRPGERGEGAASPTTQPVGRPRRGRLVWITSAALVALAAAGAFVFQRRTEVPPPPEAALMVPRKLSAPFEPPKPGVETKPVPTVPAATSITASDDKSVAVLAFANLSDDKDNEYFSDGISEELINVLGRVPGLVVKGRTSAFFFKGRNVTAQEIGEKLGVSYLVRGSVRKVGNKVRITAQLSRAATDEVVWSSEPLERELKDVFAVQDEIAGLIAKNLQLKLGKSAGVRPIDPESYRLYLEGRHFWSLRNFAAFDRAEIAFQQAVAREPESALLRAGLAELYATRGWYQGLAGKPYGESVALGAAEADRAFALDPENAQVYAAPATIALLRRQFPEAERLLRKALTLAPNDATLIDRLGDLMKGTGRLDTALEHYRHAAQLDPLSLFIVRDHVRALLSARRFEECLATVMRFEAAAGSDIVMTILRAHALVQLGKKAQAAADLRAIFPAVMSGEQLLNYNTAAEMVCYLREAGCGAEAEALTKHLLASVDADSYLPALVLAASGRFDEAIPRLREFPVGAEDRLFWSFVFDAVREDPRFTRKVGEWSQAVDYKVARDTLARMLKEQAAKK